MVPKQVSHESANSIGNGRSIPQMAYEDQDEEGRDERENASEEASEEDMVTEDGDQEQSPRAVLGSIGSEYKGKHGPHAGLTIAESLRLDRDLQGGVDSP